MTANATSRSATAVTSYRRSFTLHPTVNDLLGEALKGYSDKLIPVPLRDVQVFDRPIEAISKDRYSSIDGTVFERVFFHQQTAITVMVRETPQGGKTTVRFFRLEPACKHVFVTQSTRDRGRVNVSRCALCGLTVESDSTG